MATFYTVGMALGHALGAHLEEDGTVIAVVPGFQLAILGGVEQGDRLVMAGGAILGNNAVSVREEFKAILDSLRPLLANTLNLTFQKAFRRDEVARQAALAAVQAAVERERQEAEIRFRAQERLVQQEIDRQEAEARYREYERMKNQEMMIRQAEELCAIVHRTDHYPHGRPDHDEADIAVPDAPYPEAALTACNLSSHAQVAVASFLTASSMLAFLRTCRELWRGGSLQSCLESLDATIPRTLVLRDSLQRRLDSLVVQYVDRRTGPWNQLKPVSLRLESLFPRGAELDEQNRPQVLISGSIMAQAILKQEWEDTDLDIFCTWSAAPMVRQRLIEGNFLCTGAVVSYKSEDFMAHFDRETSMNEHRLHAPKGMDSREKEMVIDHVESWGPKDKDFNFARAVENGRLALVHQDSSRIGLPGGASGGIFPLAGRKDWYGRQKSQAFVQLIIGKESSRDARDLLTSFDMTICQACYDGLVFRIPWPELTLQSKTLCLRARQAVVEDFIRCWSGYHAQLQRKEPILVEVESYEMGEGWWCGAKFETRREITAVLRAMSVTTWEGVGMGAILEPTFDPSAILEPSFDPTPRHVEPVLKPDRLISKSVVDLLYRWRFVMALINRMHKYTRRGVDIVNAPAGSLSFDHKHANRPFTTPPLTAPRSLAEDPPPALP